MNQENVLPSLPVVRSWDREAWVGLFVISGIVAVLALLFSITEPATFRGRYFLTAQVPDAGGVRNGDSVQMRGVVIGRVNGFDIGPKGVAIRLEIYNRYKVPAGSKVMVRPNSLLGEMAVDVVPGESTETLRDGAAIPGSSQEFLGGQVNDVAGQLGQTLERLQAVLSEQNVENLSQTGEELPATVRELSAMIAEQREQLGALSTSLARSAQGLERATSGPQPKQIVQNIDAITTRLDQTTASLDRVVTRLDRGEGALGRLSKDEALYVNANQAVLNLSKAADSLQALIEDIKKDPKRYFKFEVF